MVRPRVQSLMNSMPEYLNQDKFPLMIEELANNVVHERYVSESVEELLGGKGKELGVKMANKMAASVKIEMKKFYPTLSKVLDESGDITISRL